MHVISRPTLIEAAQRYPAAAKWLHAWWTIATKMRWQQLADVRLHYPSADQVNRCLIFDVGGNKFRFICRVTWAQGRSRGTLLIKHFLTHANYDKDRWKADCK